MKDSTAAPSTSQSPAPKGARGKSAGPKSKAKAVAKARARAKTKAVAPQPKPQTVAPQSAKEAAPPASKAPAAETVVDASPSLKAQRHKAASPVAKAPGVSMPEAQAVKSSADGAQVPTAAPAKTADTAVPEISVAKLTSPKIVAPKHGVTPSATAQDVSAKKPDPSGIPAKSPAQTPLAARANAQKAQPNASAVAKAPVKTNGSKAGAPKSSVSANMPKVAAAKVAASATEAAVTPRKQVKAKLRPLHFVGIVVGVVLTAGCGLAVGTYNNWSNSQLIAPKVRVAGEPIGGLTREQAVERLNQRFGKLALTLQTDDKNVMLGLADIGGQPSVEPTVDKAFAIGRDGGAIDNFMRAFGSEVKPRAFMLPIEWNRGALTSRLGIVNKQYAQPAADARLVTVNGAAPRVEAETYGRALDISATADVIQKSYFLGLPAIKAVTGPVGPKVRAADLAGRDMKLGEWRTNYNGGIVGRTTNIKVACRAIDGQVFMPGEVLSFNELTGERTYKKGYRMAHIFLREKGQSESQVVDGLAGGVCQVSSTLYNAVRKINSQSAGQPLEIVERNSHSLPVTYVAPGRDATVAWPYKDFKFRNTHSFPIYVRTASGNGRLTISIWGRVPDNQALPVSLDN